MQQIDQFINFVGLEACDYEKTLIGISHYLGFRRPSYLALLYLSFSLLLIYLNIQPQFISDFIGFCFPTFKTLQALNSIYDSQLKWITYWIMYSLVVLSHKIILYYIQAYTLYYILRIAVFIYLFSSGAEKLQQSIEILYKKYSQSIERKLEELNQKFTF
ncbi:unnamed protein product [Paramecium primaurelia]|uniref:Uncharacterized protein n=2 Tax=Paramecium TaxID=5884 RepID=A0A8S1WXR9_9CILI|nr:unnamed protein product [Paramecium primaurelia]CAD8194728.1 unnamed protein product [Paramecium pentaurelia]